MLIPLFNNDADYALFATSILLVYRLLIASTTLNLNELIDLALEPKREGAPTASSHKPLSV